MSIYDYMSNFWYKNEYKQCSMTEIALYFCLLYEANRQHWASPFMVVTKMLIARLGTTNQNIMKARKSLMQRGLITFSEGESKGKAAFYTLSLNTTDNNEHSQVLTQALTQTLPQEVTPALPQVMTESLTQALPPTNKKEEDTIREEKKGANVTPHSPHKKAMLTLDELKAKLLGDAEWQEGLSKQLDKVGINLSGEALKGKIIEFFDEQRGKNVTHKEEADCRSHVYNWINYRYKSNKYGQDRKREGRVGRVEISDNRPEDYEGAC